MPHWRIATQHMQEKSWRNVHSSSELIIAMLFCCIICSNSSYCIVLMWKGCTRAWRVFVCVQNFIFSVLYFPPPLPSFLFWGCVYIVTICNNNNNSCEWVINVQYRFWMMTKLNEILCNLLRCILLWSRRYNDIYISSCICLWYAYVNC